MANRCAMRTRSIGPSKIHTQGPPLRTQCLQSQIALNLLVDLLTQEPVVRARPLSRCAPWLDRLSSVVCGLVCSNKRYITKRRIQKYWPSC